jgi:hypothetical protein
MTWIRLKKKSGKKVDKEAIVIITFRLVESTFENAGDILFHSS